MSNELIEFESLRADIEVFVSPVSQIVVTDIASGQVAVDTVKTVKAYLTKLEAKRKELVGPLNEQVKQINAYAKSLEAPLLKAEAHIKATLVSFEEKQEKIRQQLLREEEAKRREIEQKAAAEKARIQAELDKKMAALNQNSEFDELFGSDEPDPVIQQTAARLTEEAAEKQARLDQEAALRESQAKAAAWDIESTRLKGTKKVWKCELTNLEIVPRAYLTVQLNTAAVLAAARGGITQIPGVRIWQDTQLAIGATTSIKSLAEQSRPDDDDPTMFKNS